MQTINHAKPFNTLSKEEVKTIKRSRKSLLFNDTTVWIKRGGSDFDVTKGSIDGVEICELVVFISLKY